LIGNLLVNTAASVVATALLVGWLGAGGLVVAVPVLTVTLLMVGEITPKMLALRYRLRQALMAQGVLSIWLLLTRPVLAIIAAATSRLLDMIPLERTGGRSFRPAEMETACDLAVEDGTLTSTEGRFLARLLLLQSLEAHQIMTPRPDVVTVETSWNQEQILACARCHGFSRFPVVAQDQLHPIGLFHLKDLLGRKNQTQPLERQLRPIAFVPESKNVGALLAELRTSGSHLVAVVDEHGDFTGIVTLSDCLQALLGPVGDVSGLAQADVIQVGPSSWVIAGLLDLRDVNEACGIALPPSRDYVTVAGLLMARLGRIPRPGDRVTVAGARLTVLEMEGHKILRVQVEHLPPVGSPEP
jgi:CBS domain containing-hemolysin-like protein